SPKSTIRARLKTSLSSLRILPQCRTGGNIALSHLRMHNEASRDTLEREFGTSNDQEVIFHILEKGEFQESDYLALEVKF
ncbi:hypothetical protein N7540_003518, partial [Penicillium herquei]